MAPFSEANFGYSNYATYRPTYPPTLFTSHLLPYHHGPRQTLLDLGCGPGIVTRPLSRFFTRAIGTDPSPGMLSAAAATTPAAEYSKVSYREATAESLPFLSDGEVDMVVAAQCAHWFSYPEFWAEMARVVRPGGTVAAWGYKDFVFPGRWAASKVVAEYTYGKDKLGPYWTQPGRDRVQGRYRCLVPPVGEWEGVERWEYETFFPEGAFGVEGQVQEVGEEEGMVGVLVKRGEGLMGMRIRLGMLEMYARTWSSVFAWKEANPGMVARREGGSGDLMDELFDEIRGVVPEWNVEGWEEIEVEVELGHGVVCARRKGGEGQ